MVTYSNNILGLNDLHLWVVAFSLSVFLKYLFWPLMFTFESENLDAKHSGCGHESTNKPSWWLFARNSRIAQRKWLFFYRYSPLAGDLLAGNPLLQAGSPAAAAAASAAMNGSGWCIFVYNLAPDTEENILWQLFGPFGAVQVSQMLNCFPNHSSGVLQIAFIDRIEHQDYSRPPDEQMQGIRLCDDD